MASGVKLVFEFKDNEDKTVQYSYNHADSSVTVQQVNAHATSMITNTAVLGKTLVSISKIKQVITTENEYEITNNALRTKAPEEIINGNPEPEAASENESVVVKRIE